MPIEYLTILQINNSIILTGQVAHEKASKWPSSVVRASNQCTEGAGSIPVGRSDFFSVSEHLFRGVIFRTCNVM